MKSSYLNNGLSNEKKLTEWIEIAFERSGISTRFDSVSEIIKSDKNSAAFIREVLHDESYNTPNHKDSMYEFSKTRAQHSVLTFLVGLVFLEFGDFQKMIQKKVLDSSDKNDVVSLWMLTALYHDWGYYSEDLKKPDLDFKKIVKYDLLSDDYKDSKLLYPLKDFSNEHPHVLAYTYDEIRAYDRYARSIHPFDDADLERVDHGILSGVKIFDRIIRKVSTEASNSFDDKMDDISKRLLFAKIACLTIAQHNMFRSEKIEDDAKYGDELKKLHSKSDFRISMDTPLLMLLSLVDTFECIKRFGKTENERDYLQKNTILESIMLNVTMDSIVIDYIQLSNRIEKKDNSLQEEFSKYLNGLCGISKWTMFLADMKKDRIITIRIKT